MGKKLHVVKKQREYGSTEAFNWCFDKFRKLLEVLGCLCQDDKSPDFWELTKDEYNRSIAILKIIREADVPMDGDLSEQKEKIDQIYNSDKFKKLFDDTDDSYYNITADSIDLYDVIDSLDSLDIDLDELMDIMNSFLKEADKKSDWIQFEAW